MSQLFPYFLFAHIFAAIVAFGPTFALPLLARMGAAEPQHANFATRISHAIETKITIPAALTMPISGVLMIWSAGIDPVQLWLIAGIVLYTVAIVFAIAVQAPAVERVVHLTSGVPAAAGPGAAPAGLPPELGAAPAGPPPGLGAAIAKVQRGGMLLTVLIIAIVALMILRPTI